MRFVKFSILVMVLLCLISQAFAVPDLLTVQARLTDSEGNAVPDGLYQISFSIYDADLGGNLKWTEIQNDVEVSDGTISAFIGVVNPILDTVFNGDIRFLELAVNGQIIEPRFQLVSVPFSQRVSTIDGAESGQIQGTLVIQLNNQKIIENDGITIIDDSDRKIMSIGTGKDDLGAIDFWEPVDTKDGFGQVERPIIQLNSQGLIIFGATEADTNLYIDPDGNIVGLGQITMGENSSDGNFTTVLGYFNTGSGDSSTIGGGTQNTASGTSSVVAAGHLNVSGGIGSTVSGGIDNQALGDYSTVPGGLGNTAGGHYSYAAGRGSQALHDGSFVWSDMTDENFGSTAENQFIIRASGGVGIGTDNPRGILEIVGSGGDTAIIFPDNSISPDELSSEPGVSGSWEAGDILLDQPQMVDLVTTTITIPDSGYIVVRGIATLKTIGTSKSNYACIQIDETVGGAVEEPFYVQSGSGDADSPNVNHYYAMSTERIYFKQAGTYTFRLEGTTHPDNNEDAVTVMQRPYVSAIYFSTAYGSIGPVTR